MDITTTYGITSAPATTGVTVQSVPPRNRRVRGPMDTAGKRARVERNEGLAVLLNQYLDGQIDDRRIVRDALAELRQETSGMRQHVISTLTSPYGDQDARNIAAVLFEAGHDDDAVSDAHAATREYGCDRVATRAIGYLQVIARASTQLEATRPRVERIRAALGLGD